jgi:uncharacterized DUF497 family protein
VDRHSAAANDFDVQEQLSNRGKHDVGFEDMHQMLYGIVLLGMIDRVHNLSDSSQFH